MPKEKVGEMKCSQCGTRVSVWKGARSLYSQCGWCGLTAFNVTGFKEVKNGGKGLGEKGEKAGEGDDGSEEIIRVRGRGRRI